MSLCKVTMVRMENTGVICILISHLSPQMYIVQNLNEKYVYLISCSTHTHCLQYNMSLCKVTMVKGK